MNIVIFPHAKPLRNGEPHPKNYPFWPELINKLQNLGHNIIQVGISGEPLLVDDVRMSLTIQELSDLIISCDLWIGVDSFGQHLGWSLNKQGIAIFGQSDPLIFGHPENINILKSRSYLREKQFWLWEQADYNESAFVDPEVIINQLKIHW